MEWAFVATSLVFASFCAFIAWKSDQTLNRVIDLLGARSYGEYAQGQKVIKGAEKQKPDFEVF